MKRPARIVAVAVAAAVLAVLVPMLATAEHIAQRDPNDTKGLLDIKRAARAASGPRWKVVTWREWGVARIWDRGNALVYVDSFGSRRADYYVLVRSDDNKLQASLYRDRSSGKDRPIRAVRVRHPGRKLITVTVPMGKLRRRDSRIYRWYVVTLFSGTKCRQVCIDRAPDSGSVTEPGPVPSPTPTLPTPTPTPTPTQTSLERTGSPQTPTVSPVATES